MAESGIGDDPDITLTDNYNLNYSIKSLDRGSYMLGLRQTILPFIFVW